MTILDALWPRLCEVSSCGCVSDRPSRHICSACVMRIPFVPQTGVCRLCGRAVAGFSGEFVCLDCRTRRPAFDAAASAVRFEEEARRMLLDYKFNRHLWLRDDLTDWLEGAARVRYDVAQIDAVLPIPVTLWHRFDRGYSQTALLARELALRMDRAFLGSCVTRRGNPARQAGLGEDERRENVRGTFVCRNPSQVKGRTLLVVDDVMTTGATLSECAATLKAAGAARVWCVTVARSIRD